MSNKRHTKGPWFVYHDSKAGLISEVYDGKLVWDEASEIYRVPAGTNLIARVANVGSTLTRYANANLIAKAPLIPDLVAELKLARKFVDAVSSGSKIETVGDQYRLAKWSEKLEALLTVAEAESEGNAKISPPKCSFCAEAKCHYSDWCPDWKERE